MIIAGLERTSLVDWPEKICSTVFLAGCNLRCPFCHNPELVLPESIKKLIPLTEDELLTLLLERKRLIDGVCITGGEPLISPDVIYLIKKLKENGFSIKLDTNGSVPSLLKKLIGGSLIDYIAMDIKAPKEKYCLLTRTEINLRNIEESVKLIKESNIDYEFRTTVVRGLIEKEDVLRIAEWIKGAKAYYIQQFVGTERTLDQAYKDRKAHSPAELKVMLGSVESFFEKTGLRGV
jgi:pyruvate formate lyase activating enzyme